MGKRAFSPLPTRPQLTAVYPALFLFFQAKRSSFVCTEQMQKRKMRNNANAMQCKTRASLKSVESSGVESAEGGVDGAVYDGI